MALSLVWVGSRESLAALYLDGCSFVFLKPRVSPEYLHLGQVSNPKPRAARVYPYPAFLSLQKGL